jgi:CHASE2 domain-containing sensor protein
MTLSELRADVVILACAVSAGIQAALVPEHFAEGAGTGIGFVLAALAAAVCAVLLTRNPSRLSLLAAAAVLAGLILSYVLVLVTGLPVLHPDREPVEGLALFTKAVEAIGLVVAASGVRLRSPVLFHPKGTLT